MHRTCRRNPMRSRGGIPPRGFTLIELICGLTLLGITAGVMAPLIVSVSAQRRAAEQRQCALIHAENLLDTALSQPQDQFVPDRLQALAASVLPADLPLHLPDLQRDITVARVDDGWRITVEIRWKNRGGDFTSPVRLTGWKFPPGGDTP